MQTMLVCRSDNILKKFNHVNKTANLVRTATIASVSVGKVAHIGPPALEAHFATR